MEDPRLYTLDEAIKTLSALENHLADLGAGRSHLLFCAECIQKHAYYLWELSDEGQRFFPESESLWAGIGQWAQGLITQIQTDTMVGTSIFEAGGQARTYRKTLMPLAQEERKRGDGTTSPEPPPASEEGAKCAICLKASGDHLQAALAHASSHVR